MDAFGTSLAGPSGGGLPTVLTAAVEGRVPVPFSVIPSAGTPVSETNPAFVGELIPQPFTPLSGQWAGLLVPAGGPRSSGGCWPRPSAAPARRRIRAAAGRASASASASAEFLGAAESQPGSESGPARSARPWSPPRRSPAPRLRPRRACPPLRPGSAASIEPAEGELVGVAFGPSRQQRPRGWIEFSIGEGRPSANGRYIYPTAQEAESEFVGVLADAIDSSIGGFSWSTR